MGQIGSKSSNGEVLDYFLGVESLSVHQAYRLDLFLGDDDIGYSCAIKLVPILPPGQDPRTTSAWRENRILEIISKAVEQRICPNLPLIYATMSSKNCTFNNPRQWISEQAYHMDIHRNIMFRVIAGIYCMEEVFGVQHNDLHYGNVLIHHVSVTDVKSSRLDSVTSIHHIILIIDIWCCQSLLEIYH